MSNPPNKGNKWTDEQKKEASKRMKKCHKHLCGSNNPATRDDVRQKIRESKLGEKNPRAKKFKLISPTGKILIIFGGIKRKLKELGLVYISFRDTGSAKGWTLKRLEK